LEIARRANQKGDHGQLPKHRQIFAELRNRSRRARSVREKFLADLDGMADLIQDGELGPAAVDKLIERAGVAASRFTFLERKRRGQRTSNTVRLKQTCPWARCEQPRQREAGRASCFETPCNAPFGHCCVYRPLRKRMGGHRDAAGLPDLGQAVLQAVKL
jgi:hypothetical protein